MRRLRLRRRHAPQARGTLPTAPPPCRAAAAACCRHVAASPAPGPCCPRSAPTASAGRPMTHLAAESLDGLHQGRTGSRVVSTGAVGSAAHNHRMGHGQRPPLTSAILSPPCSNRLRSRPKRGPEGLETGLHARRPTGSSEGLGPGARIPALERCDQQPFASFRPSVVAQPPAAPACPSQAPPARPAPFADRLAGPRRQACHRQPGATHPAPQQRRPSRVLPGEALPAGREPPLPPLAAATGAVTAARRHGSTSRGAGAAAHLGGADVPV